MIETSFKKWMALKEASLGMGMNPLSTLFKKICAVQDPPGEVMSWPQVAKVFGLNADELALAQKYRIYVDDESTGMMKANPNTFKTLRAELNKPRLLVGFGHESGGVPPEVPPTAPAAAPTALPHGTRIKPPPTSAPRRP